MKKLEEFSDQKILILGIGKEGRHSLSFLRARWPKKNLGIADQRAWSELEQEARDFLAGDDKLSFYLGPDYLKALDEYDIIFKSPGISPFVPEITAAALAGKLTSQTAVFFEERTGQVIGVTGTKGKSTVSSLIYETLKQGGLYVRLIGNIGVPPLSALEGASSETVFVAELSSHQLIYLTHSPHIAVVLNIFPEHQDYYPTADDYLEAKANITRYQLDTDYVIFHADSALASKIAHYGLARKMPFSQIAGEGVCSLEDQFLTWSQGEQKEKILTVEELPLRGSFNVLNVMPAIVVGKLYGLASETIAKAIKSFHGLEHRLELVAQRQGVKFYNDSLATVPEASLGAIDSFAGQKLVVILGGFDRGQNFSQLVTALLAKPVKALILFPTTGERIWQEVQRQAPDETKRPAVFFIQNMSEAVKAANQAIDKEGVVLLSPASPSFGLFKDYRDRGQQFKAAVQALLINYNN